MAWVTHRANTSARATKSTGPGEGNDVQGPVPRKSATPKASTKSNASQGHPNGTASKQVSIFHTPDNIYIFFFSFNNDDQGSGIQVQDTQETPCMNQSGKCKAEKSLRSYIQSNSGTLSSDTFHFTNSLSYFRNSTRN